MCNIHQIVVVAFLFSQIITFLINLFEDSTADSYQKSIIYYCSIALSISEDGMILFYFFHLFYFSEISVFDLLGDDGLSNNFERSPVREAHVAFSVEGMVNY